MKRLYIKHKMQTLNLSWRFEFELLPYMMENMVDVVLIFSVVNDAEVFVLFMSTCTVWLSWHNIDISLQRHHPALFLSFPSWTTAWDDDKASEEWEGGVWWSEELMTSSQHERIILRCVGSEVIFMHIALNIVITFVAVKSKLIEFLNARICCRYRWNKLFFGNYSYDYEIFTSVISSHLLFVKNWYVHSFLCICVSYLIIYNTGLKHCFKINGIRMFAW